MIRKFLPILATEGRLLFCTRIVRLFADGFLLPFFLGGGERHWVDFSR